MQSECISIRSWILSGQLSIMHEFCFVVLPLQVIFNVWHRWSFLNLDNRVNDEVASYIIDEKVLRKLVSEEVHPKRQIINKGEFFMQEFWTVFVQT